MLPRVVLFDLDGTLIDSVPLIVSSMQFAFAGHPNAPGVAEWVALIGTPLDAMIRRWAGDEADVGRVKDRYKEHQWANHDAMVHAFPGIPAMLDALTGRGVRMAVVTSKLEPSARRSLDFLGLSGHFEFLVGLESTERHKPDPAPVLHAVERLGVRTEDAAFVGDSPHDVMAGNAAGVATVATLWGPFSRAELAVARPTAWAASPGELLGVLGALKSPGA